MDILNEALITIKNECKKHNSCLNCPFRLNKDDCAIQDSRPDKWSLRSENDHGPKRLFD